MKRLAMICAAVLMAFGVIQAQNSSLVKVHFSTPVTAGVIEMPAGDATIQVIEVGSTSTLLVRSASGAQTTLLVNRISRSADYDGPETAVQLERKGDGFILDQVWISGTQGFQILR